MTTPLLFAVVSAAVLVCVVGVLLGLVIALRRQVGRLTAEVDQMQPDPPANADGPAESRAQRTPRPPAEVPVITAVPGAIERPEPERPPRVVGVAVSAGVLKAAAFGHGVRRALSEDARVRMTHAMRKEMRRQYKTRRRARRARYPAGRGDTVRGRT